MPSEDTLEALHRLTADPRNVVFIISGRDSAFLEQHLGHFDKLGMSAEHGGFFREPGQTTWSNLTEKLDMSWMSEVEEIFRYYTEVRVCPRSQFGLGFFRSLSLPSLCFRAAGCLVLMMRCLLR